MSIETLLALYYQAEEDTLFFSAEPDYDSSLPAYGTLEEREKAVNDEYNDRALFHDHLMRDYQTRSRTRAALNMNPAPADSLKTPSQIAAEEIDDVEIVYATGSIEHQEYVSDDDEMKTVNKVFQALIGRPGQTMQDNFEKHARNVPGLHYQHWAEIVRIHFSTMLKIGKVMPILYGSKIQYNISQPAPQRIFSALLTTLLYSPVSESECERVF